MFRSVQSKLVLVYLLLIVVAMELASLYLLKELEGSYIGKVQDDLDQSAQLLAGQLSNFLVGDRLDPAAIRQNMEHWPGNVLVLDANGVVIGATLRQPEHVTLLGKKFTHDDVSPAYGGLVNKRVGTEDGQRMVIEALPITASDNVVGVVYLKASLEEAYARLRDMRDILLVATGVAMASTVVLGFMLARTITGPIREVTRKAAEIAGGNFDRTIQIRSNDEIGQLGEMFNRMSHRLKQTLDEIQGEKDKVEAILTHMADGLVALNSLGRIIKLNPAAERMFLIREEEAIGRRPSHIWPEVQLDEALAEARELNTTVIRPVRTSTLVLQAYITPLRGEKGQPAGAVLVFHDITELEKLEALRREFVANVSHELKTPLTTVKSYVETLLDGAAEDQELRSRFLHVVESETDRMARLVRDLLRLTHLDEGTARWDIQPNRVSVLIEECVGKLSVQAARKDLSVQWEIDPAVDYGLYDYDKLQQVLINLLANAIEFTPAGGEIRVKAALEAEMIRISVKDTGIGIPAEDLPRIFERFYRVDKARSRVLGGTGLGLAIAKQIVELGGGQISIASQLGQGTEVTFTVPIPAAVETRWS